MRADRSAISTTIFLTALLLAACARETPAPEPATDTSATTATAATPPPVIPQQADASYESAMDWLRSTPGFRFTIRDGDIEGEGEMRRETIGVERVIFRSGGTEWRAGSGPQGVVWERRGASGWSAESPEFGNRIYQRVTLAFDPQKKEGSAQLVTSDATTNHYRFTNANSGEIHDAWVSRADGHVERITIGSTVDVRFTPVGR
jgi:hypothetical protein